MVKERRCALLTPNIRHRGSVDHGRTLTATKGRISPDRAVGGPQNAQRSHVAGLPRISNSR